MYVIERFELDEHVCEQLKSDIPPFGYNGFGELIFFRTYSRIKKDGGQEDWADVVIRNINGVMSIRKDWYIKNHIDWDERFWQTYATGMAMFQFQMKWMPPGRGLWAMGTDFMYERGSMALYNCAATTIETATFAEDIAWLMDALMHGVGVGFEAVRDNNMRLYKPQGFFDFDIPDSREGWTESERLLIRAFTVPNQKMPRFTYGKIREAGLPIKGFGGVACGPGPLRDLHGFTVEQFDLFGQRPEYDSVYLKTNIANLVGCCVVAGNLRRSAELGKGKVHDPVFMDLKDYQKFPEREAFGWMSNNSVELETAEDFDMLGEIAKRVITRGEPGYINRINMKQGRIGKKDNVREDKASLFNPCGEIPLENKEVCNVVETLPTMCSTPEEWYQACEYATLYASTVSLLPTYSRETNKVVARNRRIGVSIVDFSGWKLEYGVHKVTKFLRKGYKRVRATNHWANDEAGVPHSLRLTTIKPGGTTPKLAGRTPGIGHPTFDYTIRRFRLSPNVPVAQLFIDAGIPHEPDVWDKNTYVFEYPIVQGPAAPAEKVSLWEQAMNLILVQREWSDNAVSNTLYFKPRWKLIVNTNENFREALEEYFGVVTTNQILDEKLTDYLIPDQYKIKIKGDELNIYEYDPHHEEDHIEPVLSAIAPLTKSVALLPHSPKGAYKQMPEEGISEEEYYERLSQIKPIDWSNFTGSDGIDEKYCEGPVCERRP